MSTEHGQVTPGRGLFRPLDGAPAALGLDVGFEPPVASAPRPVPQEPYLAPEPASAQAPEQAPGQAPAPQRVRPPQPSPVQVAPPVPQPAADPADDAAPVRRQRPESFGTLVVPSAAVDLHPQPAAAPTRQAPVAPARPAPAAPGAQLRVPQRGPRRHQAPPPGGRGQRTTRRDRESIDLREPAPRRAVQPEPVPRRAVQPEPAQYAPAPSGPGRAAPATLVCRGLTARYAKRTTPTITDVSFSLTEGGLVAVIGPSGSGKSTLCAAMLGEIAAVTGQVRLDGLDLLASPELTRHLVSFVPQKDALHDELTARRALEFTAELRLGEQADEFERSQRVEEVLDLLELAEHADKRIGQLSGGQRKRVAVAMELLSSPRLLMLDEPTSGLDEGLDLIMMRLLRRVADTGPVVIVVTHSMTNLRVADTVLAMDVTGQVAYAGPPAGLLDALDVDDYAEAMRALRTDVAELRHPDLEADPLDALPTAVGGRERVAAFAWSPGPAGRSRPAGSPLAPGRRAGLPAAEVPAPAVRPSVPKGALRGIGMGRSVRVLLRRELARLTAHPFTLARGVLLLPLLTCVLAAWAADHGLAGTPQLPNKMQGAALSVLVTCTTFFGMALSFSAVVGDRQVIHREHRWGVPSAAVVMAKGLALLGPAVGQAVVTWALYGAFRDGPTRPLEGLPVWFTLTTSLVLLSVAAMGLGLLVSAASRTLDRAVYLLMGTIAVLVVLTGLLIPLGNPSGVGGNVLATVSQLAPSRWGAAAFAAFMGYVPNEELEPVPGQHTLGDSLWTHAWPQVTTAWICLALLALTYVFVAAQLLTGQQKKKL